MEWRYGLRSSLCDWLAQQLSCLVAFHCNQQKLCKVSLNANESDACLTNVSMVFTSVGDIYQQPISVHILLGLA